MTGRELFFREVALLFREFRLIEESDLAVGQLVFMVTIGASFDPTPGLQYVRETPYVGTIASTDEAKLDVCYWIGNKKRQLACSKKAALGLSKITPDHPFCIIFLIEDRSEVHSAN